MLDQKQLNINYSCAFYSSYKNEEIYKKQVRPHQSWYKVMEQKSLSVMHKFDELNTDLSLPPLL